MLHVRVRMRESYRERGVARIWASDNNNNNNTEMTNDRVGDKHFIYYPQLSPNIRVHTRTKQHLLRHEIEPCPRQYASQAMNTKL